MLLTVAIPYVNRGLHIGYTYCVYDVPIPIKKRCCSVLRCVAVCCSVLFWC